MPDDLYTTDSATLARMAEEQKTDIQRLQAVGQSVFDPTAEAHTLCHSCLRMRRELRRRGYRME